MNKKEFNNGIDKFLIDLGFVKVDKKLYRIENEELSAVIDIQKSNYDACSYYINYGFIIKSLEQLANSTPYPGYDVFGRYVIDNKNCLISIADLDMGVLKSRLEIQIRDTIFAALKIGIKAYMKNHPEYLPTATLRAKKYLNSHSSKKN